MDHRWTEDALCPLVEVVGQSSELLPNSPRRTEEEEEERTLAMEGLTEGGVEGRTMSMYPDDEGTAWRCAGWNELHLLDSIIRGGRRRGGDRGCQVRRFDELRRRFSTDHSRTVARVCSYVVHLVERNHSFLNVAEHQNNASPSSCHHPPSLPPLPTAPWHPRLRLHPQP